MNDAYKSLYESTKAALGVAEEALKAATKDNEELTVENNKLKEKAAMLDGITEIKESLRKRVLSLSDDINARDDLIDAYRMVIKDVLRND